jgi:polar amino acid transport system permease protein
MTLAVSFGNILDRLLPGAVLTIELTVLGSLLAAAVALVSGLMLTARARAVRAVARVYVEFFRGTSMLVQLFWLFFALPAFGVELAPLEAGVLGLGLNIGAYGAEVVRGAINAVPRGQTEAAIALNMSPALRMRRIILPQAVVAMLPPFGNLLIELLKSTALVSLITLSDLTFRAQLLRAATGDTLAIFSTVLGMYFVMALVITFGIRALERRASRGLDVGRQWRTS